ncbi:MAG: hypothetical protein J1E06_01090, partial [Acutalibacter sp.]|nr:hypothetical protein [Acutalibacter sp.]
TVIATGFEGMNGEKARSVLDMDLDDDFLSSSSIPSVSSSSVAPVPARTAEEPRLDPAVIDDDDTFTDIMSIFNRK